MATLTNETEPSHFLLTELPIRMDGYAIAHGDLIPCAGESDSATTTVRRVRSWEVGVVYPHLNGETELSKRDPTTTKRDIWLRYSPIHRSGSPLHVPLI